MHTKEPWTAMRKPAKSFVDHGWRAMAMCGSEWMIAAPKDAALTIVNGVVASVWSNEENARRIVACVNACAGIPTAELDKAADDTAPVFALLMNTTQQRDELLEALKETAECLDAQITGKGGFAVEEVLSNALEAIAKATE